MIISMVVVGTSVIIALLTYVVKCERDGQPPDWYHFNSQRSKDLFDRKRD